ncbi:MAG: glycosyltransferase, partial [Vicinamibacterales bacterium]
HATGEIVAYTDADVRVDPLWLAYLVQPFLTSDVVGSGGPNVVPADDPRIAQCVARAPGGPAHVLLDDRLAEHVPGCNMAFRREALRAIGGFNPIYLRAGDDVDVCWRLQARGWKIAFSASALVWHHHRASVNAYWRQQVGYGEGEAWLAVNHPDKFVGGDMLWRGRIYSPLPFIRALYRDRLNTGAWGTSAFPSVYSFGASGLSFLPTAASWIVLSFALIATGLLLRASFAADAGRGALLLGTAGVVLTLARCVAFAARADYPHATLAQRLLIAWLHVVQPLARLRGRVRGRFSTPADLTASAATTVRWLPSIGRAAALTVGIRLERRFWTERWLSLSSLLDQLVTTLRRQRGAERVEVDDGWSERWDVALPIAGFARLEARNLVEEHADGKCLVRSSTRLRPTAAGVGALAALAAAIAGAMILDRSGDNGGSLAVVLMAAFALFWSFRRVVLASARMRAALADVAGVNLLMPLGERPAWRPAFAGVAAGTLQASMVIALGAFFVITAGPTVWDAADDYFPARHAPIVVVDAAAPIPAHAVVPAAAILTKRAPALVAQNTTAKKYQHHSGKPSVLRPLTRKPLQPGAAERRRTTI